MERIAELHLVTVVCVNGHCTDKKLSDIALSVSEVVQLDPALWCDTSV
jgi:hypothetical protein